MSVVLKASLLRLHYWRYHWNSNWSGEIAMNYSTKYLAAILAVTLSAIAHAEVYESKDAEGNAVFTDSPAPGAEEVALPQTNVADRVEKLPGETAAPNSPQTPAKPHEQQSNIVVIPNSRDEDIERGFEADQPHEVLDAEERHEVGDNPTAAELERRKEAREGEYIDEEGNTVRVEHRGHAGR
jgi:hypothetical protein